MMNTSWSPHVEFQCSTCLSHLCPDGFVTFKNPDAVARQWAGTITLTMCGKCLEEAGSLVGAGGKKEAQYLAQRLEEARERTEELVEEARELEAALQHPFASS